jgi:intein/homing endonuclease
MKTVLDGSKELLIDVATILNNEKVKYVIIGGWSPYLRNKSIYEHPGTKDVDILFADAYATEGIREIIKIFLEKGYLISAKHDFQLLKTIKIGDYELIYNIDLLHPSEIKDNPEMFVDQLDLKIYEGDIGKTKCVRSFVLPSSQILFEENLYSAFSVPNMRDGSIDIPMITEIGCILSKCESVTVEKRRRDAFDIFISVMSMKENEFAEKMKPYRGVKGVRELIKTLEKYLSKKGKIKGQTEFDFKVHKYIEKYQNNKEPSAIVREMITRE